MVEHILTSKEGNFVLVKISGVGMNDTPYEKLEVRSLNLADKHVVRIDLVQEHYLYNYEGEPIRISYKPEANIMHGMRSVTDTVAEIKEYIAVLEEAVEFHARIVDFIESHEEWQ